MDHTESDILIIGAGAGGAAAAWRLAQHGLSVLCLERGDWVDPGTSPSRDPAWELIRQAAWHPNPNRRGSLLADPVDDADSEIKPLFFDAVGGSTVMWSCHLPRFHPSDFRTFSLDGFADDWPIGYADLAPYYDLNETMMGVAGLAGNPAYPPMHAPRFPPVGLSAGARRLVDGFERTGISWWPGDIAIDTREGGCNHCGPCELHCPRRAKAATDLTYWPAAIKAGARLMTGARAVDLLTSPRGAVRGVVWMDAAGRMQEAHAPVVILAANGLGSARFLLNAPGAAAVHRSGLVGRRLMLHPLARVTGLFDTPTGGHRGITAGALVSHHFYETDPSRGFRRGIKLQALGTHGPALTALGSLGRRVGWGRGHHADFARLFGHACSLSICADDAPDPENRVTLSEGLRGSDGLPAARMIYRVPDEAKRALDFGRDRAREILTAAGAHDLIEMQSVPEAGFHLMGTARMGADRETSVLDPWCEAHDLPGLFVTDGSAFVTAAAVNPTNTLQALALRAADRIAATRAYRPG